MALTASALQALTQGSDADAWRVIVDQAVEIARKPLAAGNAPSEVVRRDREIGALDLFLSSSGWDLWPAFGDSVERNSDRLTRWWAEPFSAKAVLILDGLSLRELPWLLQGAKERGFTTHEVAACASELPGETDEFARALGFASRSKLQNNGGAVRRCKRWHRWGSPGMTEEGRQKVLEAIRLRCVEDGDCLIWTGACSRPKDRSMKPQPAIWVDGATVPMRRASFIARGGVTRPGYRITTICENPLCVAEEHIVQRSVSKVVGGPRTPASRARLEAALRARATLDMEKARAIRASDKTPAELSAEYGVGVTAIYAVLKHRSWRERGVFSGLMAVAR